MTSNPLERGFWEQVTREERFFTSYLYHDIQRDSQPFRDLLCPKLNLADDVQVIEAGFEVCFFRDVARFKTWIARQPTLEKLTFDFVITFSNSTMTIIEAKAQQAYGTKQLDSLKEAIRLIQGETHWPLKPVFLAGLHSSKYTPTTANKYFEARITWNEIAAIYPNNASIYTRADTIFRDKSPY